VFAPDPSDDLDVGDDDDGDFVEEVAARRYLAVWLLRVVQYLVGASFVFPVTLVTVAKAISKNIAHLLPVRQLEIEQFHLPLRMEFVNLYQTAIFE
jgi:hypothetical protein